MAALMVQRTAAWTAFLWAAWTDCSKVVQRAEWWAAHWADNLDDETVVWSDSPMGFVMAALTAAQRVVRWVETKVDCWGRKLAGWTVDLWVELRVGTTVA